MAKTLDQAVEQAKNLQLGEGAIEGIKSLTILMNKVHGEQRVALVAAVSPGGEISDTTRAMLARSNFSSADVALHVAVDAEIENRRKSRNNKP